MKAVIYKQDRHKVPIKSWVELTDLESEAIDQAERLATLDFAVSHVALMPDCHVGYGMPIGGVLATDNIVIPNCVGADIGCGMRAVKLSLHHISKDELKTILGKIKEVIPVGKNHNKEPQEDEDIKLDVMMALGADTFMSALKQVGTLGGGNHFIEIQKGSDGHIWLMVHSGSRNIGHTVATRHNKIAKELNKKWCSSVPPSYNLAFLPLNSKEGEEYFTDMSACVHFARENRKLIVNKCLTVIKEVLPEMFADRPIDVSHNYAVKEHHFGRNLLVHRKGATKAYKDEWCIIPGSQGSASYIGKGLGNPDSFKSCSHGAGRKMSRTKAKEALSLENEQKILDDQGILHSVRSSKTLDEAVGAYKDIETVMENQTDLVEVVVKLKPLAVIKG